MKIFVIVKEIDNGYQITFKSQDGDILSCGNFSTSSNLTLPGEWLDEVKKSLLGNNRKKYTTDQIYKGFSNLGIEYGPFFKGIDFVEVCDNVSEAKLTIKSDGSMVSLLDCTLQSGMAISLDSGINGLMPFTLGAMILHDKFNIVNIDVVTVFTRKLSPFRTNIVVCDKNERPLLSLIDLGIRGSAPEKMSA